MGDPIVYVAGHRGLVGSAICRRLESEAVEVVTATRDELDLRNQAAVDAWFADVRPSQVYLAAGTVGGVYANDTRPAEFLYDNLLIHATVVHAAHVQGVEKLLYLGSSCIYPRVTEQPIVEGALLGGPLEPTNEAYAIAKIAGVKLCESYRRQYGADFISAMPTNLYGPNDNFDLESSHLLPALIRKFHEAKVEGRADVSIWGSGRPRRELMHVDDLADACVVLMERYSEAQHVNVGTGIDHSITEIAEMVAAVVHPDAELVYDPLKPDGIEKKLLDVSRLRALGWRHQIDLADGIALAYEWFLEHVDGGVRGI